MDRPAMLVDIMWPIMSVLEGNIDAPMREVVSWELQLADSSDGATLRDTYADRLHEWSCAKREADVRKEAERIRGGGTIPLRRYSPLIGLRYPPGQMDVGTDESPILVDAADVAREVLEKYNTGGGLLVLPNSRAYGEYEWDVVFAPGAPLPEVERTDS